MKEVVIDIIKGQKALPLFYRDDPQECLEIVRLLYAEGVGAIEFVSRGEEAISNFEKLVELKSELPDLTIGIGTIKTAMEAGSFIRSGADFLVSPIFDHKIAEVAHNANKLWIPGCMTPSEINQAVEVGCTLIKLFPADIIGTSFVSAVKPLFPGISYMATGGITLEKEAISSWFKAGAQAVGLGSSLVPSSPKPLDVEDLKRKIAMLKSALSANN